MCDERQGGKRFDTSNKRVYLIDYGRRRLVRSGDVTVRMVTDGERVRDKVIRLSKRFDRVNKRPYLSTTGVVDSYA